LQGLEKKRKMQRTSQLANEKKKNSSTKEK
jgi:hypothetical protein